MVFCFDMSHLAPAIEYYTLQNIRHSSYVSLAVYTPAVHMLLLLISLIFWNFDPSQCRSVYTFNNNNCPVVSRLIHPAPFGIPLLVSFLIIPSLLFLFGAGRAFSTFAPCLHYMLRFFCSVLQCSKSQFACWLINLFKFWFSFWFPFSFKWFIPWELP